VAAGFQNRGVKIPALEVALVSTVPLGGGLSSSAALEVCAATLLETVTGTKLDPIEKALLCQQAEHEFAGAPCGIMDQFVSVMGQKNHLLLLDCRSRQTELVPLNNPSVALLIINTNVKHELSGGEYAQRRAQCETAAKILGLPSLRDATADALERARRQMDLFVFGARATSLAKLSARFRLPKASAIPIGRRWAGTCMPVIIRCATISKSVARSWMRWWKFASPSASRAGCMAAG